MLSVKDIMVRIRSSTHDQQKAGYRDEILMGYINDGVRFLRRTIMAICPELIANAPVTGTLLAGVDGVKMELPVSRVVDVRANGKRLLPVSIEHVNDRQGKPERYYMTGFDTLHFFPVPEADTPYSIIVVSDMQLLGYDDKSPFPTEIDDFLIEYVVIRASVSNEFDVSQETSIMGTIVSQVENVIRNLVQKEVFTDGYWDSPLASTNRHWRRY